MAVPATVRVKISSEAAEYVSLTPVVTRDMPFGELIETMLGVAGRDSARIAELLRRGSLVSGASRLRWAGIDVPTSELAALIEGFPVSDPSRPFAPAYCAAAVLRGPGTRIEVPRETAARKRLLRRRSFWDALLEIAGGAPARYVDYSYKDRGDRYIVSLPAHAAGRLRESASLLSYSGLENQVRHAVIDEVEFVVSRPGLRGA